MYIRMPLRMPEMKKKAFRINSGNTKQASVIQGTFLTEQKLGKEPFLAKNYCLLGDLCVHF